MVAPALAAFAPAAGQFAQGIGSALGGAPSGPAVSGGSEFADRNAINIAPIGVNVGEILKPMAGPVENGGTGLASWSRLVPSSNSGGDLVEFSANPNEAGFSFNPIFALALLGGAGVLIWLVRR